MQVLKGPQGTLFGRNTTGGAVLLVPQKPTDELEGYVEASGGNYNLQRMQGVLNAPFGDNFRVRLGVDWNTRDGYLNNVAYVPNTPRVGPKDFNDVNYTAVRLSAVWDITPNLENYTIASYSDSDTNGYVPKMSSCRFRPAIAARTMPRKSLRSRATIGMCRMAILARAKGSSSGRSSTRRPGTVSDYGDAEEHHQLRRIPAGAVGGHLRRQRCDRRHSAPLQRCGQHLARSREAQRFCSRPLPRNFSCRDSRARASTTRSARTMNMPSPWTASRRRIPAIYLDCVDLLSFTCTDTRGRLTPAPGPWIWKVASASATVSRSRIHIPQPRRVCTGDIQFTDQFSLTAGIRYTSDDTSGLGQPLRANFPAANTPAFGCANPPPLTQGGTSAQIQADPTRCNISRSQSSDEPTWLIDFDYKPTDDVLLYAKYARGYRQGSVNVSSYGLETWGPEQVDTYEIGAKTSWDAAVGGVFNIAVFYNDFTDQQLQLGTVTCTTISLPQCPFVPSPAAGIANAGKSTIQGVEVETVLNLFEGFRIELGYTYLDTKIESITLPPPPLGFTALTTAAAGGPVPLTPENKYAVTLSYTLPLSETIGRLTFSATGTHQDEMLGSVSSQSSGLYVLPEQELLNLNLTWESIAGLPLDLNIYATNVTEEEFWTFTTGASFGFDSLIVNEPAMYGARLKYRFGK